MMGVLEKLILGKYQSVGIWLFRNAGYLIALQNGSQQGEMIMKGQGNSFTDYSVGLIRVLTNTPKFLRLYFALLTDNRVASKAKVSIVTAVAALGAYVVFGTVLYKIQLLLTRLVGPWAFLPSVAILLITLDRCQKLIAADIFDQYEKEIFGPDSSLQADLEALREFMGSTYDRFAGWWQGRIEATETKMEEEGLIVDGAMTDTAIQEIADQIVELETSEALRTKIDDDVKLIQQDAKVLADAKRELLEKLPKD